MEWSICQTKSPPHFGESSSRRTTSMPLASPPDAQVARRCDQEDELRITLKSAGSESRPIFDSRLLDVKDLRSRNIGWRKQSFEQQNEKVYYLRRNQAGPPMSHRPVLMMAGLEKLLT